MPTDSLSIALPLVFLVVLKLSDMAREMNLVNVVESGKPAWGAPFFINIKKALPPTGRLVHIHTANNLVLNITVLAIFASGLSLLNVVLSILALLIWILLPVLEIDEYDIIKTESHLPPTSMVMHVLAVVVYLAISCGGMVILSQIKLQPFDISFPELIIFTAHIFRFEFSGNYSFGIIPSMVVLAVVLLIVLRIYYIAYFSFTAVFLGHIAHEVANRESINLMSRTNPNTTEEKRQEIDWENPTQEQVSQLPSADKLGFRSKQILYHLWKLGGTVPIHRIDSSSPDFLVQKSCHKMKTEGLVERVDIDEYRITTKGRRLIEEVLQEETGLREMGFDDRQFQ